MNFLVDETDLKRFGKGRKEGWYIGGACGDGRAVKYLPSYRTALKRVTADSERNA